MFVFSKNSTTKLTGVSPPLIAIAFRALYLSPHDFGITCGVRTIAEQLKLLDDGKTTTLKSYHMEGLAVDFAVWIDGKITWDFDYYRDVAESFKRAADEYGYKITWGGDWKTFIDGPHIQLEI